MSGPAAHGTGFRPVLKVLLPFLEDLMAIFAGIFINRHDNLPKPDLLVFAGRPGFPDAFLQPFFFPFSMFNDTSDSTCFPAASLPAYEYCIAGLRYVVLSIFTYPMKLAVTLHGVQ